MGLPENPGSPAVPDAGEPGGDEDVVHGLVRERSANAQSVAHHSAWMAGTRDGLVEVEQLRPGRSFGEGGSTPEHRDTGARGKGSERCQFRCGVPSARILGGAQNEKVLVLQVPVMADLEV